MVMLQDNDEEEAAHVVCVEELSFDIVVDSDGSRHYGIPIQGVRCRTHGDPCGT